MTLLKESGLYRLFVRLRAFLRAAFETGRTAYQDSALGHFLTSFGIHCAAAAENSRLCSPFRERESTFSAAWEDSRLCHILTAACAIPGALLHRWYLAWQNLFEDSFFARLAFSMGEGTAIAESILIMLLWTIPYAHWDNMYSLEAFVFLLLLLHAGAMRNASPVPENQRRSMLWRRHRLDMMDIGFYPLVFFGAVILGTFLSSQPALSYRFLGYHCSAALCVLVTVSAVRDAESLKRLCAGASVCVGVSSAFAILQRIQGVAVNIAYVDLRLNPDMPGRVTSYFDNPNTFGEVLVILMPLTLALALCARRRAVRVIAWAVWAAAVAALVMTYSRAGYLGFALSAGLMVLLLRPSLLPALAVLCVAAIPFLPSAVWTRILTITNFSDTTTSSRFPLYEAALRTIARSPLTGAGLGVDAVQGYIMGNGLYDGYAPFVHAHNLYLEVWIETGLLGIAGFLASLLWCIRRSVYTVLHTPPSAARTITCAAAAALCGITLCGMADYPWHYPRVLCIFWFLFAVALSGVKVCRTEAEERGKG